MAGNECMVSVLCTAYNHEEYIAQTLQCIVDQQTDFAFELLVNDDASTDGTAAIIRKFEEKYPHIIRAFYQKDNLYSQHKNAYEAVLFAESRGKYIAFCEGDDYWSDMTKLQRQVEFLEAHPEYSATTVSATLPTSVLSAAMTTLIPISIRSPAAPHTAGTQARSLQRHGCFPSFRNTFISAGIMRSSTIR